jgi:hypothetical protein
MKEKHYGALPFLLALASLVTLVSSFALFLLTSCESGFPLGEDDRVLVHGMTTIAQCLLLMGWIPGLALAVVSLVMLRRFRNWPVKIATIVLSSLTIMAVMFWALVIYTILPHR